MQVKNYESYSSGKKRMIMTHDEYKNLCERFEVEIELQRLELTKKLQDQRGPILYMGSPKLRKQLRLEWEETQRKEMIEELAYRTKRSELEYFGIDGKEGAKAKIKKEEQPEKWWARTQKFIKKKLRNFRHFITKPFTNLTGRIYIGR